MKSIKIITGIVGVVGALTIALSSSCTKEIENIYYPPLEIDTNLFPGIWEDYVTDSFPTSIDWPEQTNTDRNILIEDFTGHQCIFCPLAADIAEQLHQDNPERVFVASIHSGPEGIGEFQSLSAEYPTDFTCDEGLEIGQWFGNPVNDDGFIGNPRGPVSRMLGTDGNIMQSPNFWTQMTNDALAANELKINIQSRYNYYEETKGGFLHVEVEVTDPAVENNSLYLVGYVLEDTLVGDQKMPDNSHNETYVHRETLRSTIDGRAFGTELKSPVNKDGKTYFYMDYSVEVPNQLIDGNYNPDNMHMLLYVYDDETKEIYQVIKQKFK